MLPGFKKPKRVLFFWLVLVCAAVYYCAGLKFNYDFETFFPDNDPALPFFQKHRSTFGYDNEFILVAVENKQGIFEKDFLEKVNNLTGELKQIDLVEEVASPTNLKKTSFGGLGLQQTVLLHYDNPELYADDSATIYKAVQWKNTFFAADAKSLCIYLKSKDGISKAKSDWLAKAIESSAAAQNFEKVHYAGRIFAQALYLKKLQEQFMLFLVTSFVLISLLLWFTFKKIGAVILPLSLVMLSLLMTFGIMGLVGKSIDIMAIMIPSMVFVAGMSDVVHFYTKYSDEMSRQKQQKDIFKLIYKEVAGPTFLTLI
jgi:predicted RND superfamily exporter protein